jgi:mannosyltransferase OCH1-like enzyme
MSTGTKIPKLIHMIWVGGPRPQKFDPLVQKIKEINDDYEVIEWNEQNIDFDLINKDLIDSCQNFGAKSDILRFEILNKFGGIYIDYDFLQIKKFDDLLNYDFFAGSGNTIEEELWNSIVGSAPGNQIVKNFLKNLSIPYPIGRYEFERVMNETGPYYFLKVFNMTDKSEMSIARLNGDYFFPFPASDRYLIRDLSKDSIDLIMKHVTDKTYCVHLHTTTWQ